MNELLCVDLTVAVKEDKHDKDSCRWYAYALEYGVVGVGDCEKAALNCLHELLELYLGSCGEHRGCVVIGNANGRIMRPPRNAKIIKMTFKIKGMSTLRKTYRRN